MKEISPLSVYIHCHRHIINLAIKDTLSNAKLLRDIVGIVQALYNFIEASPQRHAIYVDIDKDE